MGEQGKDKDGQNAGGEKEEETLEDSASRDLRLEPRASGVSTTSTMNGDSSDEDDDDADDFFEPRKEYEDVEEFYRRISKKLKWQDKTSFTIGALNLIATSVFFGAHNVYFVYLYTLKYAILLPLRFVMYNRQKWHYFMLDFCYYANTALLLYCWVFYDNSLFFKIVYATAHGPLLAAVALFRNSIVFHSADKMTSAFIHISPPLLTHLIRWYRDDFSHYVVCEDAACSATFWELTVLPAATFVAHEIYYFFVTSFVKRKKLRSDPAYLTSFRYLAEQQWVANVLDIFGKRFRKPMFIVLNGLYGFLTVLPVWLYWHYYWVEFVVLAAILVLSLWNGAGFYIEVFARRQHEKYTKFGAVELKGKKKN